MQRSAHIEAGRSAKGSRPAFRPTRKRRGSSRNHLAKYPWAFGLMPSAALAIRTLRRPCARAAEICERVDDPRGLFVALARQGPVRHESATSTSACGDTRRILALANERMILTRDRSASSRMERTRQAGNSALRSGTPRGIARYEQQRDHHLTYKYSAHDPRHVLPRLRLAVFGAIGLPRSGHGHKP